MKTKILKSWVVGKSRRHVVADFCLVLSLHSLVYFKFSVPWCKNVKNDTPKSSGPALTFDELSIFRIHAGHIGGRGKAGSGALYHLLKIVAKGWLSGSFPKELESTLPDGPLVLPRSCPVPALCSCSLFLSFFSNFQNPQLPSFLSNVCSPLFPRSQI